MINPVTYLLRLIALKRNCSHAPHGLRPLSRISSATVLVDPLSEDAAGTASAVRQYFDYHSIPVHILCPGREDLDLIGTIKKKVRGPRTGEGSGELFISLVDRPESFFAEYEARCSRACFKVGRRQLSGEVFDLVVLSPERVRDVSQTAVFAEIKNYLNIIR